MWLEGRKGLFKTVTPSSIQAAKDSIKGVANKIGEAGASVLNGQTPQLATAGTALSLKGQSTQGISPSQSSTVHQSKAQGNSNVSEGRTGPGFTSPDLNVGKGSKKSNTSTTGGRTSVDGLVDKPVLKNGKDLHPRVRPINKRQPINAEYAGKVYPLEKLPENLRQKYPHSVPFTGTGHPDFSRYAIKKVQIEVTGKNWIDFPAADKAAGITNRSKDYTWHHHHDGKSMYLVPRELHEIVKHTGGVAIKKHHKGMQ